MGTVGKDTLIGGEGNDRFVFIKSYSLNAVINDFKIGQDRIDVYGSKGPKGFDDLQLSMDNHNAVITFSDTQHVTLKGVDIDDLQASDFLFQPQDYLMG